MEDSFLQSEIYDSPAEAVFQTWRRADPTGGRTAQVLRSTFDQLYDGQHTGRYRWDQLNKTEKTHFGTLFEINLRREFDDIIDDGRTLDYLIEGYDVDCKYSQHLGSWMIPPEAHEQLLLVASADDKTGKWSLGVVRATATRLGTGRNRDRKATLNSLGRMAIRWLAQDAELPPNVLLSLDEDQVERILGQRSGQQRVNELLRTVTNRRVGRNTIATVAQQDDYMKRIRSNGGARSALAPEGIIIPGGDYSAHREVARQLGAMVPEPGEVVSLRVSLAQAGDLHVVILDGQRWRLARPGDPIVPAPGLPDTRRAFD